MREQNQGPKTGKDGDDPEKDSPAEFKGFAEEKNAIEPPEPWPEPGQSPKADSDES